MIYKKLVLFLSVVMCFLYSSGQTQHGYVKTKGRLGSSGTVIAGTRLQGVTVWVKGGNAVVSSNKGNFSITIPGNNYFLQSVQKTGYVLTDPDVLSKQYAYSKNPLVLVMETPNEQADDKLAAERKIRRTLQRQLQEKEDEIESLKEHQKLSEEEYRKQLQEIYAQQESNEKLISEMADRYSKIDFDEVDEFNRRISQLILDGKLTEADSLLNTKGDINSRTALLRQHQEANAQAEQEIKKKQKKLEISKALAQKELEDLAQDCYSKFEIFKMLHQNDSAAYYIELRAGLDSTNIERQCDAGECFRIFFAEYNKAMSYYQLMLRQSLSKEDKKWLTTSYNNIGLIYKLQGNHQKAKSFYTLSLETARSQSNCDSLSLATILQNIGSLLYYEMEYDKALEFYQKALAIDTIFSDPTFLASLYDNIGIVYHKKKNYEEALKYYNKALAIRKQFIVTDLLAMSSSYINIGGLLFSQGKYSEALQHMTRSLEIRVSILEDNHPQVATCYNNIGGVLIKQNEYQKAIEFLDKALYIREKLYGNNNLQVASTYAMLGVANDCLGNFLKSLDYYQRALSIRISLLGNDHSSVIATMRKIDSIKKKTERISSNNPQ